MPNSEKSDRILMGVIGRPHGIRGEVWVKSFTEVAKDIAVYGALESADGAHTFTLKIMRETQKGLIARIGGVDDRTTVESLTGTKLYVARDKLPGLEQDSFYHSDLVGLRALSPSGADLGTVKSVQNFGAGDILEIDEREGGATLLIPFVNAFVPKVSLQDGTVTVVVPQDAPDE